MLFKSVFLEGAFRRNGMIEPKIWTRRLKETRWSFLLCQFNMDLRNSITQEFQAKIPVFFSPSENDVFFDCVAKWPCMDITPSSSRAFSDHQAKQSTFFSSLLKHKQTLLRINEGKNNKLVLRTRKKLDERRLKKRLHHFRTLVFAGCWFISSTNFRAGAGIICWFWFSQRFCFWFTFVEHNAHAVLESVQRQTRWMDGWAELDHHQMAIKTRELCAFCSWFWCEIF